VEKRLMTIFATKNTKSTTVKSTRLPLADRENPEACKDLFGGFRGRTVVASTYRHHQGTP
jgi:hypothetical protein